MRIAVISDTHGMHAQCDVPDADVLIFAGDGDFSTRDDLEVFLQWMRARAHRHKILVAGNHDWVCADKSAGARKMCERHGIVYLEDEGHEIDGVQFWGSPYTPTFFDWAFMKDRGEPIGAHWKLIPEDVHVLITHGPPMGVLDEVGSGRHVGCEELLKVVTRVAPKYHVFGHIHEARGERQVGETKFINTSCVDRMYAPWGRAAVVFELG